MNWQVIAQLLSLAIIVLLGPIVVVVLSFRKGSNI
uniref:Photosystem II reaction center protein Psb30 n=1 Tax=Bulboplastis apyrenoidosa TaxID=1070855 RepID=A0A1Y9TMB2_9RHOD|nr:photosystem II reaction center protein ycf12 [Bulboplastis apyrenoidosa]ARO90798.1 photosystem II reaction center protein ycf12 [Bulboplastis apyrenoidosa]